MVQFEQILHSTITNYYNNVFVVQLTEVAQDKEIVLPTWRIVMALITRWQIIKIKKKIFFNYFTGNTKLM